MGADVIQLALETTSRVTLLGLQPHRDDGHADEVTFSERSLVKRALELMRTDWLRRIARFSSLACADSGEGCTLAGAATAPCSWCTLLGAFRWACYVC